MDERILGTCMFCGQVNLTREFDDREEADRFATEHCSCPESDRMREEERRVEDARDRVRELFGEGCEQYGFPTAVNDEVMAALLLLAEKVSRETTSGVNLSMGSRGTAILTARSGKVSVQRRITRNVKMEV